MDTGSSVLFTTGESDRRSRAPSLVADLNGDRLHGDAAVIGVDGGRRRAAATSALATENFAAKQATERDAELLAEPAIDDEIDGRLERQQQHGQQLEQNQRRGRCAEETDADTRRVHDVRRLLTYKPPNVTLQSARAGSISPFWNRYDIYILVRNTGECDMSAMSMFISSPIRRCFEHFLSTFESLTWLYIAVYAKLDPGTVVVRRRR